ncbi:helix-turn-helix transcriptional regulator [uncultured Maricaulis sp.]|uniref:helix-turn-helix domain-containing protein n=1 Tax=uncultured Maricaulis sp. TaxID=174710 RepID=UPI0026371364|nr:helix-turn-helix transcriptional regulator [uncultured Maricaulis sp.]
MSEQDTPPGEIIVHLDVLLARRKIRSKELAEQVGVSEQALSMIKTGKIKGIRFSTLIALCDALECQPGELFEFRRSGQ